MLDKLNDKQFKKILEDAPEPIMIVNRNGLILFVNRQFESFFGYTQEELIGHPIEILLPESLREKHVKMREHYIFHPTMRPMGSGLKLVGRHKDGHELPIDISLSPMEMETDTDGLIVVAAIHDINKYRHREDELMRLAVIDQLTGLMNKRNFLDKGKYLINLAKRSNFEVAVCFIDLDNFKHINDTYGHATGDLLLQAIAHRLVKNLRNIDVISRMGGDEFSCILSNIKHQADLLLLIDKLHQLFSVPFEINQRYFPVSASIGISVFPEDGQTIKVLLERSDQAMYYAKFSGKNRFAFYSDRDRGLDVCDNKILKINIEKEKKCTHKKINYEQQHDFLTGFESFISIREKLKKLIEEYPDIHITIILIGIDNFKMINELIGTENSDLIIHDISIRITTLMNDKALLARKSGDEFYIILVDSNSLEITWNAQTILALLSKPFLLTEKKVQITVSMGISDYPQQAQNVEELLNYANIALTQAKAIGRNNYQFFTKEMGKKAHYLYQIETDLEFVLERNELFVCYQPQIDLSTRRIIGMEALVRWQHPLFGLIYPHDFIPIAEKTGGIIAIGEWILKTACLQAKSWQKQHPSIRISVNVAAKQLIEPSLSGDTFVHQIQLTLESISLKPELLTLEITENVFIDAEDHISHTIKELKTRGVRIACDDFGVGYAAFARFKQMSLDTIKIDGSLIPALPKKEIDFIITSNLISLAKQLNLKTIAECVETTEQCSILQDLGCDAIQGNCFSKPLLPSEIDLILDRQF